MLIDIKFLILNQSSEITAIIIASFSFVLEGGELLFQIVDEISGTDLILARNEGIEFPYGKGSEHSGRGCQLYTSAPYYEIS